MRFVARGRDCDVFDLGDGSVLRRKRSGDVDVREAEIMRHVTEHGFPCPRVRRLEGPDLVMDRVDGPTMAEWLLAHPTEQRIGEAAETLADLHHRLHRIPAMGARSVCVVHLDLHPENVLVADDGPVLIDWTNAEDGDPELDLAMTWVILEPLTVSPLVRRFVDGFLDAAGRETALAGLSAAASRRLADPNVTADEAAAVRALVDAHR